jgi:maltose/maltodextrin transport system substrate-binding protein
LTGKAASLAVAAALLLASTSPNLAFEQGSLLVWINGDKGHEGLQAIGAKFTEELGIPVVVEYPEAITDAFEQAAATGDGPDILIWPHDRFGEWAAAGLIAPVEPSAEVRDAIFDFAWEAVNFDGQTWGYPIAVEAAGLIYNRDLVSAPPASFEEIPGMELPEGVRPILWDYNNAFFTFPLLAANGGFAFQKNAEGSYDSRVTGVNNAGAKQGAAMLRRLIDEGIIPAGVNYDAVGAAFRAGEVAMVINGPWAWSNYEASGIEFGVAPIPSIGGQPSRAFVSVLAANVNAASPNKVLATEFIEAYLLSDEGLETIDDDVPLGAVADESFAATLAGNGNVAATLANARTGVTMPTLPAMRRFWAAMGPALTNITSGARTVDEALDDAAARIMVE